MTLFTQEDLLLYVYDEASPTLKVAIESTMLQDWSLRERLELLQESMNQLDSTPLEAPRMEAIMNVLNYARETEPVTVH